MRQGRLVGSLPGVKLLAGDQLAVLPLPGAQPSIPVVEGAAQLVALVPETHKLIPIGIGIFPSILELAICPVTFIAISVVEFHGAEAVLFAALPFPHVAFATGFCCLPLSLSVRKAVLPFARIGGSVRIDAYSQAVGDGPFLLWISIEAAPVLSGATRGSSGGKGTAHHGLREVLMLQDRVASNASKELSVVHLEVFHQLQAAEWNVQGLGHGTTCSSLLPLRFLRRRHGHDGLGFSHGIRGRAPLFIGCHPTKCWDMLG
mmetsp:Transcript_77327/g.127748  ORF Transcript_77327/g.127748 Transcript_77327/m.127748 type:complete len:260 (+) Transcript_77327:164-943(+)